MRAITDDNHVREYRDDKQPRWIAVSIPVAAGVFIVALVIAMIFDPSVRILHPLQALIYVAVIWLTRRNNAWGFGAGCMIAAFWNYLFLRVAANDIWGFLTGRKFSMFIGLQLTATVAHFLLIIACVAGFLRLKRTSRRWITFVTAGILAVTYFLIIVILFRPQSIPLLKTAFRL